MDINYRLKLKTWLIAACVAALAASVTALVMSLVNFFRQSLAADRFSSAFIAVVNTVILISLLFYVLRSGYILKQDSVIVKTAYFNDKIPLSDISKLHHFVNENRLYMELKSSGDFLRINIAADYYGEFVKSVLALAPHIQYDISLKLETEE